MLKRESLTCWHVTLWCRKRQQIASEKPEGPWLLRPKSKSAPSTFVLCLMKDISQGRSWDWNKHLRTPLQRAALRICPPSNKASHEGMASLKSKDNYFCNIPQAPLKGIRHLYGRDKSGYKECKSVLKALSTKDMVLTRKQIQKFEVSVSEGPQGWQNCNRCQRRCN